MSVQWDPRKARSNFAKHRIHFADAVTVLEDPAAVTIDDDDPDEERFITIGMDALEQLVVVVYTWRDDDVRLISARHATPQERRDYEG